jgi:hypothetical protein
MEAFYCALERLKARFPLFSQSAIIVYLVLDPMCQRLTSAYTGQHGSSAIAQAAPVDYESVAYKSSLGVSIPEALRRPFFEALAQLEQHSPHRGKSPIIIDTVIQADAEHIAHVLEDYPLRASERWPGAHQAFVPDTHLHAGDMHDRIDLAAFPDLFKTAYYQGNTAQLAGYVRGIEQQLVQSPPQSPDDLHLHALLWQLLGKVLVDHGAFTQAYPLLNQALETAQALATHASEDACNLMAAAFYRRASIFLQHYRSIPDAYQQETTTSAAVHALAEANRLADDPSCRPAVRGVIRMKYASMLAMPRLFPEPDVSHIYQLITEARDLAEEAQQEQQGYDPVGFLHHPSGVHHTWAKIALTLSHTTRIDMHPELTLAAGEEHIRQAIASAPPDVPRWRDDFCITSVRLMIRHIETTITRHQDAQEHLRASMPANTSQRIHKELHQTLEHLPSLAERLRTLTEDLQAVVKK